MILPFHQALRDRLVAVVAARYDLDPATLPPVVIQSPPSRALGDLAVPLAFEMARRLRKAPRVIAQEMAEGLADLAGVARVEVAANGYLNVYLSRRQFFTALIEPPQSWRPALAGPAAAQKAIVEHTAINPNKAAHVGHLRNAALGDTLVRLLRFRGTPVEVQNYIDDTGVQVADVVVGFRHLEQKDLAAVRAVAESTRFDYYCWDLYARVTQWYEEDRERLALRAATLHALEEGTKEESAGNETAELAAFIADRIVRLHLRTMRRLNVDYELLTWEGDVLRLRFWSQAFDILKRAGSVFLQGAGRLAGCWVMRIEGAEDAESAEEPDPEESAEKTLGEEDRSLKVIVRSNGTVTYVGKDIAYQFWKFGLLGRDFHYHVFEQRADGSPLWATGSTPGPDEADAPRFGRAHVAYNVIDTRQAYLQKLLKQALVTMGYVGEAERSIHFSYEVVALSHATARELGYPAEDTSRAFVDVSGRKGLGVKADDLIDRLAAKAGEEVRARQPELSEADGRAIAEMIAAAAVRYFLLKYSRGKMIVFDIDEALSFEGESGPYLQYATVRAGNILARLKERTGVEESGLADALASMPDTALTDGPEADELWNLVLEASRLDEIVDQGIRTLELSVVAKYAFGLAQTFNAFYHRATIINEEREDVRLWRAAAVSYFRAQMTRAMEVMGFEAPARM